MEEKLNLGEFQEDPVYGVTTSHLMIGTQRAHPVWIICRFNLKQPWNLNAVLQSPCGFLNQMRHDPGRSMVIIKADVTEAGVAASETFTTQHRRCARVLYSICLIFRESCCLQLTTIFAVKVILCDGTATQGALDPSGRIWCSKHCTRDSSEKGEVCRAICFPKLEKSVGM